MNLKKNVSEINRLFQERKQIAQAFSRFLIAKGFAPSIVEEIVQRSVCSGSGMEKIKERVAAKIHVTGELCFKRPHKLVFVGPTGVGKTTIIFKLADYYLNQKKRIALMTLDEAKQGSFVQWAEKKYIPVVKTIDEVTDLLLIDTEGCNFYLPNRVDMLGEKIAEIGGGGGLEVVLTLSAAAKEVDLYGAVHQFSSLCPTSLIFTKLDETLASGVLVNVLAKSDLPIRYVAYGYPLPGKVELADPVSITHKILTDFNKEEFQFIRQLTLSTLN